MGVWAYTCVNLQMDRERVCKYWVGKESLAMNYGHLCTIIIPDKL